MVNDKRVSALGRKCLPFYPRKRLEGTEMTTEEKEASNMT